MTAHFINIDGSAVQLVERFVEEPNMALPKYPSCCCPQVGGNAGSKPNGLGLKKVVIKAQF